MCEELNSNKGRIKILSDLVPTGDISRDKKIIPIIIQNTMQIHNKNVEKMKVLENYYYNITNIENKTKTTRNDINNKFSIDYPSIAVTTINAYCFANPLSISTRNAKMSKEIKQLKDCLDDDNYYSKSNDMYLQSGIKGLGYKYIVPATAEECKNGIYFHTYSNFKPENTYCIYENDSIQDKIMAVNFYKKTIYGKDYSEQKEITVYDVWTKYHKWRFTDKNNGKLTNDKFSISDSGKVIKEVDALKIVSGKIPVIENIRKSDRTCDFELALNLNDAINALASYRLDVVEQNVDALFVLRDIDVWSDGALENVKKAIKDGILAFKSVSNAVVQPNVDVLDIKLNQSEIQTLQNFLCEKLEEVLHIPNRETRSSGGDTGVAVESRNGFRSLENIAGLVSSKAKESENEAISIILSICKNIDSCPFKNLSTKDIEIKENRNKIENMVNSATTYSTLRSAGLNDNTALEVSRLVNDTESVAQMNKSESEQRELKIAGQLQKLPNVDKNTDKINNGSNSRDADE